MRLRDFKFAITSMSPRQRIMRALRFHSSVDALSNSLIVQCFAVAARDYGFVSASAVTAKRPDA